MRQWFAVSLDGRLLYKKCSLLTAKEGGYFCPAKQSFWTESLDCKGCNELRSKKHSLEKRAIRRYLPVDNEPTSIRRVTPTLRMKFQPRGRLPQ